MARKASSSDPSQRMLRVGELIRHELAAFLARDEIADPEMPSVPISVSEVRVTPDLKMANVFVMPLGGEGAAQIAQILNRHQKYIRGQIAPRINLKYAPQLRFKLDETFDEAGKINDLLRSPHVAQDLD